MKMSVGIIGGNVRVLSVVTATVDLGSVAANTSEEETATVRGVRTGDVVFCVDSSLEAGIMIGGARVSATDTVTLQVMNTTAGAIDAASKTMTFVVLRPEGNTASVVSY